MDWWVTNGDRIPVGPFSTELLLREIGAGEVPKDALVCEVGGTTWKAISSVTEFRGAFARRRTPSFDPETKRNVLDEWSTSGPVPSPLQRFGDENEHTIVEPPLFPPSEPPPEHIEEGADDLATLRPPGRIDTPD